VIVNDGKLNSHYLIERHGNLDCAHWSDGPFCPHCGEREALRTIQPQTIRPGIYHCLTCRKRFAGILEILFQDSGEAADGARPRPMTHNGPENRLDGLLALACHGVWYAGHILRQIILGSDRPPSG